MTEEGPRTVHTYCTSSALHSTSASQLRPKNRYGEVYQTPSNSFFFFFFFPLLVNSAHAKYKVQSTSQSMRAALNCRQDKKKKKKSASLQPDCELLQRYLTRFTMINYASGHCARLPNGCNFYMIRFYF